MLVAAPLMIEVADLTPATDSAAITDVEAADFSGDGRADLAVAWFATDVHDAANNARFLTLYFGSGACAFERAVDINLYIRNAQIDALSVFRNGPSDVGVGDFDGDGDPDLAVTPFFGDELWFIENLGDGQFAQHLKFPFGFNSTGNFQTPPEALAADFDGDGREELVYVVDPIQYIQGYALHFWRTDDTIANMRRVNWEGVEGGVLVQWTRALALADFDGDARPDLCFTGSINPPYEDDPVMVFWHALDPVRRQFDVHLEYPDFLCSDVVAVAPNPACPPGVVVTDLDGTAVAYWAGVCSGEMDFLPAATESGYAGYAPGRGMAAVAADVNGDGDIDLVTRQRAGRLDDPWKVEVTLSSGGGERWWRVRPCPIDSSGFQDEPFSEILRPRNLAVADLFGNTLPEIVAGFGPTPPTAGGGGVLGALLVAYWRNSCVGDATVDGRTDIADLSFVLANLEDPENPVFAPDADLDKDGRVTLSDLGVVLADLGCDCCPGHVPPDEAPED